MSTKSKSVSPERRFATSPEHEMLKKVFRKSAKAKPSLKEYRQAQEHKKNQRRMANLEDQLEDMTTQLTETRERVDSISRKLDFMIRHLCIENDQPLFNIDDV